MTRMFMFKLGKGVAMLASLMLGIWPRGTNATYTLATDEDWRETGKILLADGEIDLAGHKLTVGGFADYVPLDYVETDGTQWVHTEYTPSGTDAFEMKFMKSRNTDEFLLCSRSNGSTDGFGVWVSCFTWKDIEFIYRSRGGAGKYGLSATGGNGIYDEHGIVAGRDYTVSMNGDKKFWVVNGMTNDFSNTSNGNAGVIPSGPFALFGGHTAGASLSAETTMSYMASCRFYYLKVWDKTGKLKCNIIPVYGVAEKTAGLYDTVRRKFLRPITNGGMPTTFAATYQELPYVETDGKQLVDTGFVHAWTNRIEFNARLLSTSGYQALFGSRGYASNGGVSGAYVCWAVGSVFRFDYYGQQSGGKFNTEDDYEIVMSPEIFEKSGSEYWGPRCLTNGAEVVEYGVSGVTRSLVDGGVSVRNQPCRLFGMIMSDGSTNYYAHCRFYSLKVYNDFNKGKLLCDIVPALGVKENAIGLYDKVRNKFMQSGRNPLFFTYESTVKNSAIDMATLEVSVTEGTAVTNNLVSIAESGIDFVKSGDGEWICANGLSVTGSFSPVAGRVTGITMQNGSLLDLSGRSTPLDLSDSRIAFADNATIGIKVGDSRKLTSPSQLICWRSIPPVTFVKNDMRRQYGLAVKADGLYAVSGMLVIIR